MRDHRPAGTEDSRENCQDEHSNQQYSYPIHVCEAGRVDPYLIALRCPYLETESINPVQSEPRGLQQQQRDSEGQVHGQACSVRPGAPPVRGGKGIGHGCRMPRLVVVRMSTRTQLRYHRVIAAVQVFCGSATGAPG
ncbi:hypothetical protein ADL25_40800 [Streptomyces sp. NRRL F-5122]|nr:hypothetical protein ADL25_40800 [Streptomyces sp. NRRL F-5122]